MSDWIKVSERLPECPRSLDAFGTPVLIWPRDPNPDYQISVDGFCYYGKRATGHPGFYLHGAEINGVTHWMPLPEPPK